MTLGSGDAPHFLCYESFRFQRDLALHAKDHTLQALISLQLNQIQQGLFAGHICVQKGGGSLFQSKRLLFNFRTGNHQPDIVFEKRRILREVFILKAIC